MTSTIDGKTEYTFSTLIDGTRKITQSLIYFVAVRQISHIENLIIVISLSFKIICQDNDKSPVYGSPSQIFSKSGYLGVPRPVIGSQPSTAV